MRMFLLLAFNILILLNILDVSFADREALLAFKSQVSRNQRVLLESWNHSVPLCEWTGVTCGRKHKRVTRLDLGGLKLVGSISPSIGNLSFLRVLNLEDNSFSGKIPKELGMLFRLQHLNMSNNNLEGSIPKSLFNCSRLVTLDLVVNRLAHGLPSELGWLSSLENLFLAKNNLSGKLPASLGNLTSLTKLSMPFNHFEGEVPNTISRLTQLTMFRISVNNLSGVFPPAIYNISSLRVLAITDNHFSGNLRPDFGIKLSQLRKLLMGRNLFSGNLPETITNISNLQILDIVENQFSGSIPVSFGTLHKMELLALDLNDFGTTSQFLGGLVNCTRLRTLGVSYNKLRGKLLTSVTNLSKELTEMYFEGNQISGVIPHDIGNLVNLQRLSLEDNLLTGGIPISLGKVSRLQVLDMSSNRMSGEIPAILGNLTLLEMLNLYNNSFQGHIPPSLGNCRFLLYLSVDSNRLNGTIPREIMQIKTLVQLYISNNSLTGPFPKDVGSLKLLVELFAENNKFYGNIPETLGNCLSIEKIYLGGNAFDGAFPDIRNLRGLKNFDVSNNNLCCGIPQYLANLSSLEYLNLSGNNFEGMVPTKGVFQSSKNFSVFDNKNLCGGIPELKLKPCPQNVASTHRRHSSKERRTRIGVGISVAACLVFSLLAFCLLYMRMKKKKEKRNVAYNLTSSSPSHFFHERVSYEELRTATSDFSSSRLIGSGNFGSVFKGLLGPESKVVAVKVLNLETRGAAKSFMAECEALKGIRHRNLVKLVTACSSIDFNGIDFKALVYEYMPNGNLDMWLHPRDVVDASGDQYRPLKLFERLDIAIDVASLLDYIHSHCHEPMAHCDIKPSNVLLDNDLIAHVSDFGLARIIDQDSFFSSTGVRGTIGYAAPEYGMGGKPSREGDLYSFGVLLLEIFTGKRPTDQMFVGDLTLRSYTEFGLPQHVLDMVDVSILDDEMNNKRRINIEECLKVVFHVGIRCCEESPTDRMTMAEALAELVSIRDKFFRTKRRTRRAL